MATYGNRWKLLAAFGNFWQQMETFGKFLQLIATLAAYGYFWQLMATFGNLWQLSASFGKFWQPSTNPLSRPNCFLRLFHNDSNFTHLSRFFTILHNLPHNLCAMTNIRKRPKLRTDPHSDFTQRKGRQGQKGGREWKRQRGRPLDMLQTSSDMLLTSPDTIRLAPDTTRHHQTGPEMH